MRAAAAVVVLPLAVLCLCLHVAAGSQGHVDETQFSTATPLARDPSFVLKACVSGDMRANPALCNSEAAQQQISLLEGAPSADDVTIDPENGVRGQMLAESAPGSALHDQIIDDDASPPLLERVSDSSDLDDVKLRARLDRMQEVMKEVMQERAKLDSNAGGDKNRGLWPAGRIPWAWDEGLKALAGTDPAGSMKTKGLYMKAMDDYHKHTCVRFYDSNGMLDTPVEASSICDASNQPKDNNKEIQIKKILDVITDLSSRHSKFSQQHAQMIKAALETDPRNMIYESAKYLPNLKSMEDYEGKIADEMCKLDAAKCELSEQAVIVSQYRAKNDETLTLGVNEKPGASAAHLGCAKDVNFQGLWGPIYNTLALASSTGSLDAKETNILKGQLEKVYTDRFIKSDASSPTSDLEKNNYVFVNTNVALDVVVHELGHAVGLTHTHQQPARSEFYQVNFIRIFEQKVEGPMDLRWVTPQKAVELIFKSFRNDYGPIAALHFLRANNLNKFDPQNDTYKPDAKKLRLDFRAMLKAFLEHVSLSFTDAHLERVADFYMGSSASSWYSQVFSGTGQWSEKRTKGHWSTWKEKKDEKEKWLFERNAFPVHMLQNVYDAVFSYIGAPPAKGPKPVFDHASIMLYWDTGPGCDPVDMSPEGDLDKFWQLHQNRTKELNRTKRLEEMLSEGGDMYSLSLAPYVAAAKKEWQFLLDSAYGPHAVEMSKDPSGKVQVRPQLFDDQAKRRIHVSILQHLPPYLRVSRAANILDVAADNARSSDMFRASDKIFAHTMHMLDSDLDGFVDEDEFVHAGPYYGYQVSGSVRKAGLSREDRVLVNTKYRCASATVFGTCNSPDDMRASTAEGTLSKKFELHLHPDLTIHEAEELLQRQCGSESVSWTIVDDTHMLPKWGVLSGASPVESQLTCLKTLHGLWHNVNATAFDKQDADFFSNLIESFGVNDLRSQRTIEAAAWKEKLQLATGRGEPFTPGHRLSNEETLQRPPLLQDVFDSIMFQRSRIFCESHGQTSAELLPSSDSCKKTSYGKGGQLRGWLNYMRKRSSFGTLVNVMDESRLMALMDESICPELGSNLSSALYSPESRCKPKYNRLGAMTAPCDTNQAHHGLIHPGLSTNAKPPNFKWVLEQLASKSDGSSLPQKEWTLADLGLGASSSSMRLVVLSKVSSESVFTPSISSSSQAIADPNEIRVSLRPIPSDIALRIGGRPRVPSTLRETGFPCELSTVAADSTKRQLSSGTYVLSNFRHRLGLDGQSDIKELVITNLVDAKTPLNSTHLSKWGCKVSFSTDNEQSWHNLADLVRAPGNRDDKHREKCHAFSLRHEKRQTVGPSEVILPFGIVLTKPMQELRSKFERRRSELMYAKTTTDHYISEFSKMLECQEYSPLLSKHCDARKIESLRQSASSIMQENYGEVAKTMLSFTKDKRAKHFCEKFLTEMPQNILLSAGHLNTATCLTGNSSLPGSYEQLKQTLPFKCEEGGRCRFQGEKADGWTHKKGKFKGDLASWTHKSGVPLAFDDQNRPMWKGKPFVLRNAKWRRKTVKIKKETIAAVRGDIAVLSNGITIPTTLQWGCPAMAADFKPKVVIITEDMVGQEVHLRKRRKVTYPKSLGVTRSAEVVSQAMDVNARSHSQCGCVNEANLQCDLKNSEKNSLISEHDSARVMFPNIQQEFQGHWLQMLAKQQTPLPKWNGETVATSVTGGKTLSVSEFSGVETTSGLRNSKCVLNTSYGISDVEGHDKWFLWYKYVPGTKLCQAQFSYRGQTEVFGFLPNPPSRCVDILSLPTSQRPKNVPAVEDREKLWVCDFRPPPSFLGVASGSSDGPIIKPVLLKVLTDPHEESFGSHRVRFSNGIVSDNDEQLDSEEAKQASQAEANLKEFDAQFEISVLAKQAKLLLPFESFDTTVHRWGTDSWRHAVLNQTARLNDQRSDIEAALLNESSHWDTDGSYSAATHDEMKKFIAELKKLPNRATQVRVEPCEPPRQMRPPGWPEKPTAETFLQEMESPSGVENCEEFCYDAACKESESLVENVDSCAHSVQYCRVASNNLKSFLQRYGQCPWEETCKDASCPSHQRGICEGDDEQVAKPEQVSKSLAPQKEFLIRRGMSKRCEMPWQAASPVPADKQYMVLKQHRKASSTPSSPNLANEDNGQSIWAKSGIFKFGVPDENVFSQKQFPLEIWKQSMETDSKLRICSKEGFVRSSFKANEIGNKNCVSIQQKRVLERFRVDGDPSKSPGGGAVKGHFSSYLAAKVEFDFSEPLAIGSFWTFEVPTEGRITGAGADVAGTGAAVVVTIDGIKAYASMETPFNKTRAATHRFVKKITEGTHVFTMYILQPPITDAESNHDDGTRRLRETNLLFKNVDVKYKRDRFHLFSDKGRAEDAMWNDDCPKGTAVVQSATTVSADELKEKEKVFGKTFTVAMINERERCTSVPVSVSNFNLACLKEKLTDGHSRNIDEQGCESDHSVSRMGQTMNRKQGQLMKKAIRDANLHTDLTTGEHGEQITASMLHDVRGDNERAGILATLNLDAFFSSVHRQTIMARLHDNATSAAFVAQLEAAFGDDGKRAAPNQMYQYLQQTWLSQNMTGSNTERTVNSSQGIARTSDVPAVLQYQLIRTEEGQRLERSCASHSAKFNRLFESLSPQLFINRSNSEKVIDRQTVNDARGIDGKYSPKLDFLHSFKKYFSCQGNKCVKDTSLSDLGTKAARDSHYAQKTGVSEEEIRAMDSALDIASDEYCRRSLEMHLTKLEHVHSHYQLDDRSVSGLYSDANSWIGSKQHDSDSEATKRHPEPKDDLEWEQAYNKTYLHDEKRLKSEIKARVSKNVWKNGKLERSMTKEETHSAHLEFFKKEEKRRILLLRRIFSEEKTKQRWAFTDEDYRRFSARVTDCSTAAPDWKTAYQSFLPENSPNQTPIPKTKNTNIAKEEKTDPAVLKPAVILAALHSAHKAGYEKAKANNKKLQSEREAAAAAKSKKKDAELNKLRKSIALHAESSRQPTGQHLADKTVHDHQLAQKDAEIKELRTQPQKLLAELWKQQAEIKKLQDQLRHHSFADTTTAPTAPKPSPLLAELRKQRAENQKLRQEQLRHTADHKPAALALVPIAEKRSHGAPEPARVSQQASTEQRPKAQYVSVVDEDVDREKQSRPPPRLVISANHFEYKDVGAD